MPPENKAIPPLDPCSSYEERAAILEFEAGLPRAAAEALAWAETHPNAKANRPENKTNPSVSGGSSAPGERPIPWVGASSPSRPRPPQTASEPEPEPEQPQLFDLALRPRRRRW